jgi:hypothetical protein
MSLKATLTQKEIIPYNKNTLNPHFPHDGQCKSGHRVPPGTRFFYVSGSVLPKKYWGIYCEPCLKVANKLAQKQKNNKED